MSSRPDTESEAEEEVFDAEGSVEAGDDEGPVEEYDTEEEAPPEVRPVRSAAWSGSQPAPGPQVARSRPWQRCWAGCSLQSAITCVSTAAAAAAAAAQPPLPHTPRLPDPPPLQALETAADREIARKERERLKVQDALRRQQLEKLRENQNADASKGDVRLGSVGE